MRRKMAAENDFRYILRCAIQPGFHEQEQTKTLLAFCRAAKIDDVAFFVNCEEVNQGHLSAEETEKWLTFIRGAGKKLETLGVTTSLNPWHTLLHGDRGRRLHPGQKFNLMVDYTGRKTSAQICPLCPEWRSYIKGIFEQYASVRPDIIWVEDDFRFHNHAPLKWGGCFCNRHMKEFSRILGEKVSRRKFFEHVVSPGSPSKYRKAWLLFNRKTMAELAGLFGKAVSRMSPKTKVGLMTSVPSVHCAEGRNWKDVLVNLAGKNAIVVRPHLPAYAEYSPGQYLWNFAGISLHTQAAMPADSVLYPEIDNLNVSNSRFSKSQRFARFQILLALAMGSRGITLNIFDMIGNGVNPTEKYERVLRSSKPFFHAIAKLRLNGRIQRGIRVLFSSKSSEFIHCRTGKAMEELYPKEVFWSQLLSCFGIANVLTEDAGQQGEIVAVSGQYFRSITRIQIRDLFLNNLVLLDGEAVETLCDLGLGRLAGVKGCKWVPMDNGEIAYEEVSDGSSYCGLPDARMSAQGFAGDALLVDYLTPPSIKTNLMDPAGKLKGPGVVTCGANVVIIPYGHMPEFPIAHLTPVRQALMKSVLTGLAENRGTLAYTCDNPYMPLFCYDFPDKKVLFVANSTLDDTDDVGVFVGDAKFKSAAILDSVTGNNRKMAAKIANGVLRLDEPLKSLEAVAVILMK